LDAGLEVDRIKHYFPHAASAIGTQRATAIALLSRLVGMICPGLHSLFAAFAVDFIDSSHQSHNHLQYHVSETDDRFRIVRMNVLGAGLAGSVQAFLRWPPVLQPALTDIANIVSPTEFANSTALVVGGSRGLGALTAKIIAAGGGRVIVTYMSGREEAAELVEEICDQIGPGICRAVPFDARKDPDVQLGNLTSEIGHLYYFATAPIARQKEGIFDARLLEEFMQLYVTGFYDCCRFVGRHASQTVTAYYPSSIFVEGSAPAMTEYSMAKLAGELLCASLNRSDSRIHVIVSRLPRLMTDQTATVPPVASSDPLPVMLPIIRTVQASRPTRKAWLDKPSVRLEE
jgi:hypothetical protein